MSSRIEFDPVDIIIEEIIKSKSSSALSVALGKVKKLTKKHFDRLLDELSSAYYYEKEIISDHDYDAIELIYENKYGKRTKIGSTPPVKIERISRATVNTGAKVKLPFYMGGLDKVRDDHGLELWLRKWQECEFMVEDKEDGVSACFDFRNLSEPKLYKRGDEKEGTDISHLIPYITDIPKLTTPAAVRGELVIPLDIFESKYQEEFKNPRNLISGMTNPYARTLDPGKLRDINFVVYELYTDKSLKPSRQSSIIKDMGFKVPTSILLSADDITADNMTTEIKHRKRRSLYDMDGVVIKADVETKLTSTGNPDHMIAFKIAGDVSVAKVIDIEWNVSKHGIYKPTVIIEKTRLSGVDIERASGFNAKFIVENGIGPGAKVVITRSGDVIPYILDVVHKVDPYLPDEKDYVWNENNVEITIPDGIETEEVKIMKIVAFFHELKTKFVAETTVRNLYDQGFNSLGKFLDATVNDIIEINGFQLKGAERIVENIQKSIKGVPLYNIMAASSIFPNFGAKRLKLIVENIPDILVMNEEDILDEILKIKGFKKLAEVFCNNISKFNSWLKQHPQIVISDELDHAEEVSDISSDEYSPKLSDPLRGQNIVCTGWRISSNLEKCINKRGAKVSSGVSGLTTLLVTKIDKTTDKTKKALDKGVSVMTKDQFLKEYGLAE